MQVKKELLYQWLNTQQSIRVEFQAKQCLLEPDVILKNMEVLLVREVFSDSIYILRILSQNEWIPVYIGRSNSPVNRWKAHLKSLLKGASLYKRWRTLLLDEQNCALHDTDLLLFLDSKIVQLRFQRFHVRLAL